MRPSGSVRVQRAKRAKKVRFHRIQRQKVRAVIHLHKEGAWWVPNINERTEVRMFRTNTERTVS